MMIRSAGLVNIADIEEGSTGYLDGFTDADDYTGLAISDNKGFAVDLGAEYKIDSNFTVALAINDLGADKLDRKSLYIWDKRQFRGRITPL